MWPISDGQQTGGVAFQWPQAAPPALPAGANSAVFSLFCETRMLAGCEMSSIVQGSPKLCPQVVVEIRASYPPPPGSCQGSVPDRSCHVTISGGQAKGTPIPGCGRGGVQPRSWLEAIQQPSFPAPPSPFYLHTPSSARRVCQPASILAAPSLPPPLWALKEGLC